MPIQARDDGNSDLGVSSGNWGKWSDSRFLLKGEPAWFYDRSNVECKRKGLSRIISRCLVWITGKMQFQMKWWFGRQGRFGSENLTSDTSIRPQSGNSSWQLDIWVWIWERSLDWRHKLESCQHKSKYLKLWDWIRSSREWGYIEKRSEDWALENSNSTRPKTSLDGFTPYW